MKKIIMTISYDGSGFSGWQKQPQKRTIQGEIEDAIFRAIGDQVEVFGSGRTDAGVHAFGQVAHFDMTKPVPTEKLKKILNDALPDDISILTIFEGNEGFHARFSVHKKTYLYKIYNSPEKQAFLAKYVGWEKSPLDEKKMQECANMLIGEFDFKGFCSAQTSATNFVRKIFDIKVERQGEYIYVAVTGNGFLYNMVRIIVGTLVDFALGKLSKENVESALISGDRSQSGKTMSACGLYLKEVFYTNE